ncbi:hypothetical protein H696_00204 [Fonticula alba]|uniref:Uncharacterized protein n=1 Tax=Fonticula alba TaxID=691883 RepID=A0A058ZDZ4_FONAL|nr:hypothetical protein H696_00204 [Fonticula alba]KCV72620.1 hypothetical protein H696_00204 [Fonticula alba]|eukprot:XP_009492321.1 hypothetical protein H696_00204 [Fonticula alba]
MADAYAATSPAAAAEHAGDAHAQAFDTAAGDSLSFGYELRDQLDIIDRYARNSIALIDDLRDMAQERAELEKDYASRLERQARSFARRRQKAGRSILGAGSSICAPGSDHAATPSDDPDEARSSIASALATLHTQTEESAKARQELSEQIINEVVNPLKFESRRIEEARNKHLQFAQTLRHLLDQARDQSDKARDAYRKQSASVDAVYNQYDKCPDHNAAQKLERDWNEALREKRERSNEYLLCVEAHNALRFEYYHHLFPAILNNFQELTEHAVWRARELINTFIDSSNLCMDTLRSHNDIVTASVAAVDACADSQLFIRTIRKDWIEPPNEEFKPYSETDAAILHTQYPMGTILMNTYLKYQEELDKAQGGIDGKNRELDGLRTLYESYYSNPSFGDAVKVRQDIIAEERSIALFRVPQVKIAAQKAMIDHAFGPEILGQIRPHAWKSSSKGSCPACGSGLSLFNKGHSCTSCNVAAHSKCQIRLPPMCGADIESQMKRETETPRPSGAAGAVSRINANSGASRPVSMMSQASSSGGSMRSTSGLSLGVSPGGGSGGSPFPNSPLGAQSPVVAGGSATAGGSAHLHSAKVLFDFSGSGSDELTVKTGDEVQVILASDPSFAEADEGWFHVIHQGIRGLIPIAYTDFDAALLHAAPAPAAAAAAAPVGVASPVAATPAGDGSTGATYLFQARALYDYSGGSEQELSLTEGSIINVISTDQDGSGWWMGELNGKVGEFPGNYIERID